MTLYILVVTYRNTLFFVRSYNLVLTAWRRCQVVKVQVYTYLTKTYLVVIGKIVFGCLISPEPESQLNAGAKFIWGIGFLMSAHKERPGSTT
jgi:hypothetical protein